MYEVWHGEARLGGDEKARHGLAWFGMVWQGKIG